MGRKRRFFDLFNKSCVRIHYLDYLHGKCASGVIFSDTITGKSDDEIIPYNRAQNDSARLKRHSRVEIATSGVLDDAMPRIGNDLEGWLEAMERYLTRLSEQKEAD